MSRALHIFYQNLRLRDNPSLVEACHNDSLLALYIHQEGGRWAMGSASKVWLHKSLALLASSLKDHGIHLHLAKGDFAKKVLEYVHDNQITDVYFDIPIEPGLFNFAELKNGLEKKNVNLHLYFHSILYSPSEIKTQGGEPYQVFTPFYNASKKSKTPDKPLQVPSKFPRNIKAESLDIEAFHLIPKIKWHADFENVFEIGEAGALKTLEAFLKKRVHDYKKDRDFPNLDGTSMLSPHLHFGEISPHQIFHRLDGHSEEPYKRQLIWREFAHHLLYHFPKTPLQPLKEKYEHFPWHKNAALLKKWQEGMTGFPIIDAGMRQLWQTGWMHNRVRMIVGSFLVKDLMIPWQDGADWFWDCLVDADLANNTLGWQWVAGCGADAAPYFRVFNPYIQSVKFDEEGDYIKHFVPELARLDKKYIHAPHEAPKEVLDKAGIELGKTYPRPMVNHQEAKDEALKIYYKWNA
jgi:deoxyribodipyrimidine photo-lyase